MRQQLKREDIGMMMGKDEEKQLEMMIKGRDEGTKISDEPCDHLVQ